MAIREDIVELSKALIAFPSTAKDDVAKDECLDYIVSYMRQRDPTIECVFYSFFNTSLNKKVKNLHIYRKNISGSRILLLGHIDVVEAKNDQFSPSIAEDHLYGRGSGDMKGSVCVALHHLLQNPTKNIHVITTGDEEVGGSGGAKELSKILDFDFCITLEPTDMLIRSREKGGLWVDACARSSGGHASTPWVETGAIEKLMDFYDRCKFYFPIPEKSTWVNTLSVGGIYGGLLENNVPGPANKISSSAIMRLDIRYVSSKEEVLTLLRSLSQDVEIKDPVVHMKKLETNEQNPFVQTLLNCVRKRKGNQEQLTFGNSTSDTRFFSSIPCVVFGPICKGMHADDERVSISSLVFVYNVINDFLVVIDE